MKKILAKILLCIIIINTIFSTSLFNVFANKGAFKLNWEKNNTLKDDLVLTSKPEGSTDAMLSWQMGSDPNVKFDLEYYIEDSKEVNFTIEKVDDKVKVEYKINNNNTVNAKNSLEIYKVERQAYLEAITQNFPSTPDFSLNNPFASGKARTVSFTIAKGKGVNFKYMGNTVKFKWEGDAIYFVTNGVQQGTIYKFNLKSGTPTVTDSINVFTGIKKQTFKSTPIANNGKGENTGDPIDQTVRPITAYPGEDPKLKIEFELPKKLNSTTNKYEYITTPTANNEDTKVVLDLTHPNNNSGKSIQLTINNIYGGTATDLTATNNIKVNSDKLEVTATRETNNSKITLTLSNKAGIPDTQKVITPGIIYSDIKISAERKATLTGGANNQDYFEAISTIIPIGSVYTYPEYSIVYLGGKEFYVKLKPFEGYNGVYIIKSGSVELKKAAEYEEKNKGALEIMIPISVDITSAIETLYQIDFKFAPSEDKPQQTDTISSQILKYKASISDIILSTPQNLQIVESDIIRNGDKDELFATFEWDISDEEILKQVIKNNGNKPIDINYSLFQGDKPDSAGKEFAEVKAKVTENAGTIKIEYEKGTNTSLNEAEFLSGETKIIENVVGGKKTNLFRAKVKFKIQVSHKEDNMSVLQLKYPAIYFIAVEGTYKITNGASEITSKTGKSLYSTLTLNDIAKLSVPEPQNINIIENTISKNAFKISFDTLKYQNETDILNKYFKLMLEKNKLKLDEKSIKYNLYISQNKNIIDEMIKNDSEGKDKQNKFPNNIKDKIKVYNYNNVIKEDNKIDFKTLKDTDGNFLINLLRNDNVLKIENLIQNFDTNLLNQVISFSDLDENQVYYIIAETVIEPKNETGAIVTDKIDVSKFSKILTATTLSDTQIPGDSEKVPPAPTNFYAENTNLNSTNLIWNKVNSKPEQGSNATFEYQFIKTRGQQLDNNFLKTKNSYSKTWNELANIKFKEGFKTSTNKILEYKDGNFQLALEDKYVYQTYDGENGNILDKSLSPNQVYFYYIRTVRIDENGNEMAYSTWVPLSLTTKNIESPKNLKVERNTQYDKKTEVVISFDIPKINLDLIGTEYDLQYSIKKDLEAWQSDKSMPKNDIQITENKDGKTLKVTYKITGLKPSSAYTIRVRMYNNNMNAASMYSNEVDHRTDIDDANNDYDDSINNWDDNFKNLADALKKQPYWEIKNSSSLTSIIYRADYFDNLLKTSNTSIIDLPQGIGSRKEYYIPSNIIIKAFEQNKGFKITYENTDVIFSNKSISPSQNDAIKMLEERRLLDGISDYFVKITVNFIEGQYLIENEHTASPNIGIYLDVVATKQTISQLDSNVIKHIDSLLKTDKYSKNLKEHIRKMLEEKRDTLYIGQQINTYFDQFKNDLGNDIASEIKSTTKRIFTSYKLNGNLIIAHSFDKNLVAKGYKFVLGDWVGTAISDYSNKKAIYTNEIGSYIFTSSKINITGIEKLPNANAILKVINTYGLNDYLGKSNINLKANLTRNMAIGSLARISGNSKIQDPVQFFKSKDILVSQRNENSAMTTQETIYLAMKVYEIRTNKKIESIKIKDYNKISNIKGINSKYKKAIQVAFELGIYDDENMIPNSNMSVEQFLKILGNLSSKIGI